MLLDVRSRRILIGSPQQRRANQPFYGQLWCGQLISDRLRYGWSWFSLGSSFKLATDGISHMIQILHYRIRSEPPLAASCAEHPNSGFVKQTLRDSSWLNWPVWVDTKLGRDLFDTGSEGTDSIVWLMQINKLHFSITKDLEALTKLC